MEFSDLPPEIKCLIFSKFTTAELRQKVAPVNREWRHYARSPICWTDVELNDEKQTRQLMWRILKHSTNIRRLEMRNIRNFHWFVDVPTRRLLLHLTLHDCEISTDTISRLLTVFPNVEIFVLRCLNINTNVITDHVIRWPNLKNITLDCDCIGDVNKCFDVLGANCRNLTHFSIKCSEHVDDRSFGNFLTLLSSQLKHLSLTCICDVTSDAYMMIGRCNKLVHLELLSARKFTDHNLLNLRVLNHLKCLKLRGSFVLFSSEFANIFSGVKFNASVKDVSITHCQKLDDKSLDVFIKSCPPDLTKLQITCRINPATHLACQDVGRENGFYTWPLIKGKGVIDFSK